MRLERIINKSIEILILSVMFSVPIYFAFWQESFNVFELNKLVLFRILVILIFLLNIFKIFVTEKIEFIKNKYIFFFIAALFFSYIISTIFSVHPQLSLWGSYSRQQGLFSYIFYLLWFCLLLMNIKDIGFIKKIFIAILLSSFFVCFYGLLQILGLDYIQWKEDAVITGRVFSTLGQPNFLGHFIVMSLPISFYSVYYIFKNFYFKFFASLSIILQLIILWLTYSRSAWLAACVMIWLLVSFRLWQNSYKKISVGILLMPVILVLALSFIHIDTDINISKPTIKNRALSALNFSSGSIKMRFEYWQASIKEYRLADLKKKMIGYGGETLFDVFVKYYGPIWGINESVNSYPDRAHNSIFDILLQFGLFGLVVQLSLFAYVVKRFFKSIFKIDDKEKYWSVIAVSLSLAGYVINNLFSFSLSVSFIYFFMLLALFFVMTSNNEKKIINLNFFSQFSKFIIYVFIIFLSFVYIFYYNLRPLWADMYYMDVKRAEMTGDCASMTNDMEKVVDLNSFSTFYKEKYIFHNINCLDKINSSTGKRLTYENVSKIIDLIDIKEYQPTTYSVIADAETSFGYYIDKSYFGLAEKKYNYLNQLNNKISNPYYDLSRLSLWQNKYSEAIRYANSGLEVLPSLADSNLNQDHKNEIIEVMVSFYSVLAEVYFSDNDNIKAREYYKYILKYEPNNLLVYKKLADTYYREGDLEKAILFNKRGMSLNPSDSAWSLALNILYKENGDFLEADKYFVQYNKLKNKDE